MKSLHLKLLVILVFATASLPAQKMYWLDSTVPGVETLKRANMDATSEETLITGNFSYPKYSDVDLSAGKIYWAEDEFIKKADLDGSNIEILASNYSQITAMDLDLVNGKIYFSYNGSSTKRLHRMNLDGTNLETIVSGMEAPFGFALDIAGGKVYYYDYFSDEEIRRANLDGTGVETLHTLALGEVTDIELDLANDKIYWADNAHIYWGETDGSSFETLIENTASYTIELDLSAGHLYWYNRSTQKLRRSNLDGTSQTDIITIPDAGLVYDISLDLINDEIYITDRNSVKIQKCDLDGSNLEDVITSNFVDPDGIAVDLTNGKVYWGDAALKAISRSNLDGTNIETVVNNGSNIRGLALDITGGKVYWTSGSNISRANLDGSGIETLVTGLTSPREISLDIANGKMYWADSGSSGQKVQRANLDGSLVEDLATGIRAFAVELVEGKLYWTQNNPDKLVRSELDGSSPTDLITSGLSSPFGLSFNYTSNKFIISDIGLDEFLQTNIDGSNLETVTATGNIIYLAVSENNTNPLQNNNWLGTAADGEWGTAGNWDTEAVPASDKPALIDKAETISIAENFMAAVERIELSGDAVLDLKNNSNISLEAGEALNITGTNTTLKGIGAISGNVEHEAGFVAPGASPGILTITGDYDNSGGTLDMEINGPTVGTEYDQLAVTGDVTLNIATSKVNLTFGYTPAVNDVFNIVTANSISGTFGASNISFSGGNVSTVSLSYTGGIIKVTVTALLPVELSNFSAIKIDENIQLEWETQSEENNSHFEVEHSTDGQRFYMIGKIDGAGNSLAKNNYSFLHKNPAAGINYYRLKQMDFDGTHDYSKIISVEMNGGDIPFKFHPNPAGDILFLTLDSPDEIYTVHIFNLHGNLMQQQILEGGKQKYKLDLIGLPSGIYILEIMAGQQRWQKRFVKM